MCNKPICFSSGYVLNGYYGGSSMPELRVTVTKKLNELLDKVVEAGLFASKADAVRAATVYFLKDLGWLEKPQEPPKKRK